MTPSSHHREIEKILEDLFDAGKRYGEEIGYAKDEVLYGMRCGALSNAKISLSALLPK